MNNRTIREAFLLPRTEKTMGVLCGCGYFSCLEFRSEYWQVYVKEEHKQHTAFTVGPRLLRIQLHIHFDLTNSPATFQKLKHRCLRDLHNNCLVFLDEIIIFSSTVGN